MLDKYPNLYADIGARFAELAIFTHGQGCDAAASIIRHEQALSSFIQIQMAWAASFGCLLIQQRQLAGAWLNLISAHSPAFLSIKAINFAYGI